MTRQIVDLAVRGHVAVLTLDDRDRRNLLSEEMVAGIGAALDEAERDERVLAAVITGAGKAFCAGAALQTLTEAAAGDFGLVEAVYGGFLRVLRSPLLTIAAVNGPAVGAGMNLALACDLRLAGPRARFDSRFAALRLHPGGGHMWLLQRAVGYQDGVLACLLAQVWDAQAALERGLVGDIAEDVVAAAVEAAVGLEGLQRDFVRRMVASYRASAEIGGHEQALALETEAQRWSTTLPAFREGVAAIQASIGSAGGAR